MIDTPFFTLSDGLYHPTKRSRSLWGPDMLNGPAVVGALAHGVESQHRPPGFLPARITVDLFRAARNVPAQVRTRVVREGRRIVVVDADFVQHDEVHARASVVFLRESEPPRGTEHHPQVPAIDLVDTPIQSAYGREFAAGDGPWVSRISDIQNDQRKRMRGPANPVVAGEQPSPFVGAVIFAESTSLLTNLGSAGIGYINADLTVSLAREPRGEILGLIADQHVTGAGVSVGTATLVDAAGPFGTGLVTCLNNTAAQIDFSAYGV